MIKNTALIFLLTFLPLITSATPLSFEDNFMPWLEDIQSTKVDQYILKTNSKTLTELESYSGFKEMQKTFKDSIIKSQKENANKANIIGDYAYNFLYNDTYVHGLYRRVSRNEYLKAKDRDQYDHLNWENLIDTNVF